MDKGLPRSSVNTKERQTITLKIQANQSSKLLWKTLGDNNQSSSYDPARKISLLPEQAGFKPKKSITYNRVRLEGYVQG